VLALEAPLALDAETRERERLGALLADRLAPALALAEAAPAELAERGQHLAQGPAIPVAQLELELARVRGVGLVAEVLRRVVVQTLLVRDAPADLVLQLTPLGHERLA